MSQSIEFAAPRRVESPEGCFFYHTMELPAFGVVHGQWDLRGKFEEYVGGVRVEGRSVLDVGTATGFLSFEAERRGAARVVSHDMSDVRQQTLLPFKDKLTTRIVRSGRDFGAEMERWKDATGSATAAGVARRGLYGSVYELPPALGRFDVVVVGSVLEHLATSVGARVNRARDGRDVVVVTPLLKPRSASRASAVAVEPRLRYRGGLTRRASTGGLKDARLPRRARHEGELLLRLPGRWEERLPSSPRARGRLTEGGAEREGRPTARAPLLSLTVPAA